ncbi:MAG TPA: AAA family ATPase, partial [Chloroflexota bacterium]
MDATLLERDGSAAALDQLMSSAREGTGRVAIVGGEAGVGKTSLIERFVEHNRSSATVLWGACDALSTPRTLGPLRDISLQSGVRLQTLLDEKADGATLFAAFLDDLRRSGRPSIVVFEDVHWADEATLDLIKFLGRRIQHTPALFILTYRDDEVGADHPLTAVFGDLPTRSLTRVRLQPLSPSAVATLAETANLPREDGDQLYAATGGNPFFVTEVLASTSPG